MAAALPFALRARAPAALVLAALCAAAPPARTQPRTAGHLDVNNTTGNLYEEGARPGSFVHPATGELFFTEAPDLAFGGPMPLVFERYYAQFLASDGFASSRIGVNWLGTWDWQLILGATNATVVTNRGRVIEFVSPSPGNWQLVSPTDVPYQLASGGPDFRLLDPMARRIFVFDPTGRLIRVEDGRGNVHTLTYVGALLTQVQDTFGRQLQFTYDAMDRLQTLTDGTRTVSYGHSMNTLTSYTNAVGQTTQYHAAALPSYALESVQLPAGNEPWTFAFSPVLEVTGASDVFLRGWNYTRTPGSTTLTDPNGGTRVYQYNPALQVFRRTDPLGNQTSYAYDAAGRLTGVTRPLGDLTTVAYHPPSGYPSLLTLPDGGTIQCAYTARPAGDLIFYDLAQIAYPDGSTESYTHDATGNPLTFTDRAGKVWSMTWTAFGRPETITNPAGGVATYTYDVRGRVMVLVDAAGVSTRFEYDALDRLIRIRRPDLSEVTFLHDALYLIRVTSEVGAVHLFDYNLNGLLKKVTDPVGTEAQITYNGMDDRIRVDFSDATSIDNTYDELNRLRSVSDRTGRTLTFTYDAGSRLTRIADPGANEWVIAYDANDRPLNDADPLGNLHTLQWDARDRLTQVTDPLSSAEQYGHDGMDRLVTANGPLGYDRTFGYDPRSLLTSADELTLHLGLPRTDLGQVSEVLDPNAKSWTALYDASGRVTRRTDPLGRVSTYAYDGRGRLSQLTSPLGTLTYSYDAASRVIQEALSDGTTLGYAYDAAGRLLTTSGVALSHDAWGRVVASNGITFTRDAAGRITTVTYAPGRTATYTYDARGLLQRIDDWVGGTYQFDYDVAGRRIRMTRPNSVMTEYQYDGRGAWIGLIERIGPNTLSSIALARDERGQISSAIRSVPLRPPAVAASRTYAYDDASQIVGYVYDDLGRLTETTDALHLQLVWDLASRLGSYNSAMGGASFTYDGLGQPLSRTDGLGTRQWVWSYASSRPSLMVVREGGLDRSYFLWTPDGELLARYDALPGPCCAVRHSHFDESGNTLFLTDELGNIVTQYAYTPYGEATEAFPDPDNLFTFAGRDGAIREGGTGLYQMSDGFYDSRTARYVAASGSWPTANTLGDRQGGTTSAGSRARAHWIAADLLPGPVPWFQGAGRRGGGSELEFNAFSFEPDQGDPVLPTPALANPYQFKFQNPVGYSGGKIYLDWSIVGWNLIGTRAGYFNGAGSLVVSDRDRPVRHLWPPNHTYRRLVLLHDCMPRVLDPCTGGSSRVSAAPAVPDVFVPGFIAGDWMPVEGPVLSDPSVGSIPFVNAVKISGSDSPRPKDRVYFRYKYFDPPPSVPSVADGRATVTFKPSRPGQVHVQVKADEPSKTIDIEVRP